MGGKSSTESQETLEPFTTPEEANPPPQSKLLGKSASSTKIDLCVRCELYRKPTTTFVVIYSKAPHHKGWFKEGTSDPVQKATYPNYRKFSNYRGENCGEFLDVDFSMDSLKVLRFEVYRVRDMVEIADLNVQHFLGCAEMPLGEAVFARSQGDGWLSRSLVHPYHTRVGNVCLMANENWGAKGHMSIGLSSSNIRSSNFWKGRPSPYCTLSYISDEAPSGPRASINSRTSIHGDSSLEHSLLGDGQYRHPVFNTEVCRRSSAPDWKRIDLSVQQLCHGQSVAQILLEVYDYDKVQKDTLLGLSIFGYSDMQKAFRESKALVLPIYITRGGKKRDRLAQEGRRLGVHGGSGLLRTSQSSSDSQDGSGIVKPEGGKKTGSIKMDVGMKRKFSFFDFVRGGLELRMVVGIDFTRSNISVENPHSLHYIDPQKINDYAAVLRSVAQVVSMYDTKQAYPAYGFGARIPPSRTICSNCFAISGDFFCPELKGVDALVDAYQRSVRVVRLHGPTCLREVIQMAASWAEQNEDVHEENDNGVYMHFWLLLVITDGVIADSNEAVEEIFKVAGLPLHVLAVGLGDSDFSFLQGLNGEVHEMLRAANQANPGSCIERDTVSFVKYDDFKHQAPGKFTNALLGDLPIVVREYYQARELKPWNLSKFEEDGGAPKAIPLVNAPPPSRTRKVGPGRRTVMLNKSAKGMLMSSRGSTKDTNKSSTSGGSTEGEEEEEEEVEILDPLQALAKRRAELEEQLSKLPKFLKEWRVQMLDDAVRLGYSKPELLRAMGDGIPDGSLEILLDCVVNCGYGRSPSYRDLAEAVTLPAMELAESGEANLRNVAAHPSQAPSQPKAILEDSNRGPSLPGAVDSPNKSNLTDAEMCTICLEFGIDTELRPCGHRIACRLCVQKLGVVCPLCRTTISGVREVVEIE